MNHLPHGDSSAGSVIGRVLGNYRLLRPIGYGGMGEVFLAEHLVLGRLAAVKILHPELSRQHEAMARFFNEARASAALRHPGLIEVFDFGWDSAGNAYIVMELLEGASLRDLLERGQRLPVEFAVAIVRQVAEAMALAHTHGIVHRDLKPENLFLVPDAQIPCGFRVKVLDFGIAKLYGGSLRVEGVTRTGNILGTPAYMAPEQCHGAGHVDERADIYSLGCILFEMLTGRPPFVSDGVGAIIAAHLLEPPVCPSKLVPEVPAELDELVLALLVKPQDERVPSMADLVARVGVLGTGEISVHPELLAWSTTLAMGSAPAKLPTPPAGHAPTKRAPMTLPQFGATGLPPIPAEIGLPIPPPPRTPTLPPLYAARLERLASGSIEAVDGDDGMLDARLNPWPRRVFGLVGLVGVVSASIWMLASSPRASSGAEPGATAAWLPAAASEPSAPTTPAKPPVLATAQAAGAPVELAQAGSPGVPSASGAAGVEVTPLAPAADDRSELAATVTWRIESQPSGARVVRESDGAELGRTPLELSVASGAGRQAVSISKRGYRGTRAELPLDRDASAIVELSPLARPRRPESGPTSASIRRPEGPVADGAIDPYGE